MQTTGNDKVKRFYLPICWAIAATFFGIQVTVAQHDPSIGTRARYAENYSEQLEDARSASLLIRLQVASEWFSTFSTVVELDAVATALNDQFSDGVSLNGRAWVPDVKGAELNQLFGRYDFSGGWAQLGRQRIEWDNQRYVGSESFWQNDQTFDALQFNKDWLSASAWNYTYIDNANRIYGDDADTKLEPDDVLFERNQGRRPVFWLGDHPQKTHLLRMEWNEWDYTQWVVYAHAIDNEKWHEASSNTLGSRLQLRVKLSGIRYQTELELARQKQTELTGKPIHRYYLAQIGLGYNTADLFLRSELLTGRDGSAFQTPLGDLHEFQGWADQFQITPGSGLYDHSVRVDWRNHPFRITVRFHIFETYQHSDYLGRELDTELRYAFSRRHYIALRTARFEPAGDNPQVRLDKTDLYFITYSWNID